LGLGYGDEFFVKVNGVELFSKRIRCADEKFAQYRGKHCQFTLNGQHRWAMANGALEIAGPAICAVPADEGALVRAVCAGDASAFDMLMRSHRERIFSVIYHILGNREDAADLCQDAFIQAFRTIRSFRGHSKFYTWLYRIAVNLALRQMRRRRLCQFFSFERMESAAESDQFVEELAARLGADRLLLLKELQQQLSVALHSLSPKHRAVVVLAEIECLPLEEIADVMHCSAGTVRSRLHYAKEKLKISLGRYLRT
jgi:RNA polymerase sigma-70 factor (ECF subfamily)